MRILNWMGGVALAATLLVGCNSSSTPDAGKPTASGDKKAEYKITVIGKSNNNPVFPSARVGAEAAAKELGEKYGTKITIDWRTPDSESGEMQAQRISEAANEGADAILISCSDAAKVTRSINDAVDKGVQVMTFDSDAPESKRFAFYGADDVSVGQQVMDELAKQLNGKGVVRILCGNQTAPNLQARAKAVAEEAKKYPGITISGNTYHQETPQDAAAAVLSEMKAHPDITGWAMIGGWPLFTKTLLTDLDPNKVKVVAVDALPAQLPYVDKGIAPVLLAQPTYEWGHTSVKIIMEKLIDKKDPPAINKMDLERVDKAGLNAWAKKIESWGFKDIDPKYLK